MTNGRQKQWEGEWKKRKRQYEVGYCYVKEEMIEEMMIQNKRRMHKKWKKKKGLLFEQIRKLLLVETVWAQQMQMHDQVTQEHFEVVIMEGEDRLLDPDDLLNEGVLL